MQCAIMQPTYLPWSGYFNLATQVDFFIILDDVQFNKRSWQQRNRILQNGKEIFLSVPVFTKGRSEQLINEVQINNESNWRESHLKSIQMAYSKSKYKDELMPLLEELYSFKTDSLADFNLKFITLIFELLSIKTKVIRSKDIPVCGKKSDYLLNICNYLECDEYLSAIGSKSYIEEEEVFKNSSVKVAYQNYNPAIYEQLSKEAFISHLSIIDVIFNIGIEQAKRYVYAD